MANSIGPVAVANSTKSITAGRMICRATRCPGGRPHGRAEPMIRSRPPQLDQGVGIVGTSADDQLGMEHTRGQRQKHVRGHHHPMRPPTCASSHAAWIKVASSIASPTT
jgi:hypothetical protein